METGTGDKTWWFLPLRSLPLADRGEVFLVVGSTLPNHIRFLRQTTIMQNNMSLETPNYERDLANQTCPKPILHKHHKMLYCMESMCTKLRCTYASVHVDCAHEIQFDWEKNPNLPQDYHMSGVLPPLLSSV